MVALVNNPTPGGLFPSWRYVAYVECLKCCGLWYSVTDVSGLAHRCSEDAAVSERMVIVRPSTTVSEYFLSQKLRVSNVSLLV